MERRAQRVGLSGQGLLFGEVRRVVQGLYPVMLLAPECPVHTLAACGMVVCCQDTWSPAALLEINRRCWQAEVPLLPIYTQFAECLIGPCVLPGHRGCAHCAELRKLGAMSTAADRELCAHYLSASRQPPETQPWLTSFAISNIAALVVREISACLGQSDQLQTLCALLILALETLECSRHSFLPCPDCRTCAALPQDCAELAVVTLQACPKPDALTYRTSRPVASVAQLLATYVDSRMGLVNTLTRDARDLLPTVTSQLASETAYGVETATGTGCALQADQSTRIAILEVVERYAGLRPRGKRTMVRASYRQLVQQGQLALDPMTLGLQSPAQYEWYRQDHHCHPLVPYHPDLMCNWVWGYTFRSQAPLLIPEHCAYYGVPTSAENPAFVFDVSNGCALGNCLEEAIFHGMLEIIERDAFLLTWYAQLAVPRLDLTSLTDPLIRVLLEYLQYHSGYTIHAFNITLDHALACLCLLGIDEQEREGLPRVHVVAGSHPHPEQAFLRALRELATVLTTTPPLSAEKRAQALQMLADSSLVQEMEHHPLVYYLPEAGERLHFLYHSQQTQTFQAAFAGSSRRVPAGMDLRDDLQHLLNEYLQRGSDVLVVDQTAPEHLPCGLRCVKVLMPGMLPMTFGQQNRRVSGLARLQQVPLTLGYRDHPLSEAQINPHPHPFF
jgi:ribosomal protein S12 methylthiotransferase accessory factor